MADDQATAKLERIRAELRTFGASDDDAGRLLAALDAVLKLADGFNASAADLDDMATRASLRGADPMRVTMLEAKAAAYRTCAAKVREAITRALTGKEPGA